VTFILFFLFFSCRIQIWRKRKYQTNCGSSAAFPSLTQEERFSFAARKKHGMRTHSPRLCFFLRLTTSRTQLCRAEDKRKKKTLEPSHVVHVRSLLPMLLRSNSRIHDCNAKSKESVRAQLYTHAVGQVEELMRSMRFSRALHWRFLRWGERRKQGVVEEW